MKILRIPEPESWRPEPELLFAFGDYRVPLDMSEELADRAVAAGVGTLVETKVADPAPETKARRAKP